MNPIPKPRRWRWIVWLIVAMAALLFLVLQPRSMIMLEQHTTETAEGLQAELRVFNRSNSGVILNWHLESRVNTGWSLVVPEPLYAGFPIFLAGKETQTFAARVPAALGSLRFSVAYSRTNLGPTEWLVNQLAGRWQKRGGRIRDDAITRFAYNMPFRQVTIPVSTETQVSPPTHTEARGTPGQTSTP